MRQGVRVLVAVVALAFVLAPAARGGSTAVALVSQRAVRGGAGGAVFDLLFLASQPDSVSEIPSPTALALRIARSSGRKDLVALCRAASAGKGLLPIAGASKDLQSFQSACRDFESVRRAPTTPARALIARLERCEAGFSAAGAELAVATARETTAAVYLFRLSQNRLAETEYEAALAVFGRYDINRPLAVIYSDLAYSYQAQEMLDAAQASYLEAGDRYTEAGHLDEAPKCYLQAAQCLVLLGEKHLAAARGVQAMGLAQRRFAVGGDPAELVAALTQAAGIFSQVGDPERQLAALREAVKRASGASDSRLLVTALRALAEAQGEQGRADEVKRLRAQVARELSAMATRLRERAAALGRDPKQTDAARASCLSRLGWACEQLGALDKAARAYFETAGCWESAGDYRRTLRAQIAWRRCLGKKPTGLPVDVIATRAELWSQWDIACSELMALADGAERGRAGGYYERAIDAARKSMDSSSLYTALMGSGRFLLDQGDAVRSAERLQEALALSREIALDLPGISRGYLLAARAEEAARGEESGRALLEEWADRVTDRDAPPLTDASGEQATSELLARLMDAELKADRKLQADEYAARFQAGPPFRALYAAGREGHPEWPRGISESAGKGEASRVAVGRGQVLRWLTETYAPIGETKSAGGPDARHVLDQVDRLEDGAAYLQFLLSQSGVYALIARKSGMEVVSIGPRAPLEEALKELRQAILADQADVASGLPVRDSDAMGSSLARLHGLLLKPIGSSISGASRMVVGLPREMGCVPIQALAPSGGARFVQDSCRISYLRVAIADPGLPALRLLERTEPVAVFAADSRVMPTVEQEIDGIRASFPASAIYRGAAAAPGFRRTAASARVVHISGHFSPGDNGEVRFDAPGAASPLAMNDLYDLRAPGLDLVVLSCCESAGGVQSHLDSSMSLVDAFGLAGARSVVATLWRVSDRASAVFAKYFYAGLAAGKSRGEALSAAQKALRGTAGFSNPFYWSAFALFGDPS